MKRQTEKRRKDMGDSLSRSLSVPADTSPVFVPSEILEEIFHNLPYDQVIKHCRLVCKYWKEVCDSESLWKDRCRREGFLPQDVTRTPENWRIRYVLCRKRRNLLKNPRAEEDFQFWKIESNGGDKWAIEKPIHPHPNPEVQRNFVTSYAMCLKSQEIDLKSEGYSSSFMDRYQPPIKILDWYASRCNCLYKFRVALLNHRKQCVQEWEPETVYIEEQNNRMWYCMMHTFRNYGPGVRYVYFLHGGQDRVFWAGWYGVRVSDSCVEVCPHVE